jgi:hypothetical protein
MTENLPPLPVARPPRSHRFRNRIAAAVLLMLLSWLGIAYLLMPALWIRHYRRHPQFDDLPRITRTGTGIPGDPLNVALAGTEAQVKALMKLAKWFEADPLGWRSDVKIAAATVLRRSYDEAPVSNLFLFGRKEDLAFEQPVGADPRQRHHVRFWRAEKLWTDGRPIWVGAAIYDRRVGFSRTTGQITHHTAADIDTERAYLFRDLQQTGALADMFFIDDFHEVKQGRNGGGDPWYTDGLLEAGVIDATLR